MYYMYICIYIHINASDCFFICQETCVYVKIAAPICFENLFQDMFRNNLQQFIVCSNTSSIFKYFEI